MSMSHPNSSRPIPSHPSICLLLPIPRAHRSVVCSHSSHLFPLPPLFKLPPPPRDQPAPQCISLSPSPSPDPPLVIPPPFLSFWLCLSLFLSLPLSLSSKPLSNLPANRPAILPSTHPSSITQKHIQTKPQSQGNYKQLQQLACIIRETGRPTNRRP